MAEIFPAQCALDQNLLAEVARKVGKILDQMDALESRTGPIAAHELRLEAVESQARQSRERLGEHRKELEALKEAGIKLQIKMGLILVPLASGIGAVVAKLL